ncbi:MAG: hypothetical protein HN366_02355 [Deltaproteobacteria bacterium]|jgi:hypothetical protein|nr:hypothetical protein [Deltaproteobacteria bacterium]MBT6501074.1 hypothetical protein [Deltaproteobacteria bacterium]
MHSYLKQAKPGPEEEHRRRGRCGMARIGFVAVCQIGKHSGHRRHRA